MSTFSLIIGFKNGIVINLKEKGELIRDQTWEEGKLIKDNN